MRTTVEDILAYCPTVLPDGNGGVRPCPELLTEAELIAFLRIAEVSKAKDHRHVIAHLKRMRGLPCIHIARQPLYPIAAIRQWIQEQVEQCR